MAGGLVKYRHLSRNSAHRQALLRNLVTALVQHESVRTTWPKAKETQRLAEKLITLAKRNNETSKRKATGILYTPHNLLPKLFGELRTRYASRPGGYTRVLRTEPKSTYDQAPSAILELVDGPKDLRFAMTAAAVARDRRLGRPSNELTRMNRAKVVRYRSDGDAAFEGMVGRLAKMALGVGGKAKGEGEDGTQEFGGAVGAREDGVAETEVERPQVSREKPKGRKSVKVPGLEDAVAKGKGEEELRP